MLRYEVEPAAFLLGVAAATSSNMQLFSVLTSTDDPARFAALDALRAGLRFHTNGARLLAAEVTPDEFGVATQETYMAALAELDRQRGTALKPNHYIVLGGRAAPSMMYGLSTGEGSNYILGGWADFTQVRPARIVACAVKHPGVVLRRLLTGGPQRLLEVLPEDELTGSFAEHAIDVTPLDRYMKYNPDGQDIADAVAAARAEIDAGEMDIAALIEQYRD
jgi:hypothetical protein